ncbi:hypothetical protein CDD80_5824 [Ophiocordyceps camponoti-rufipedis]|uniref:Mmc1 C-terminal domain-containing protein n=1 Tax=Ophiocordyceps camponoti-rufipedis TaxID=2004952 RepID=A0A2C5ZND0_9HYPO|nr:hypothetical protein CDD80_5824 [Ophiocordyceps camponoti-rufipedis]
MACRPGLLPRSVQPRLLPRPCPNCFCGPIRPRLRSIGAQRSFAPARRRMTSAANPRAELEGALVELQRRFPRFVDASRLQLALQGLRTRAGDEIIRFAVLSFGEGDEASRAAAETARTLLGTLLADPLAEEAPWEKELQQYNSDRPLLIRIGSENRQRVDLRLSTDTTPRELHLSSPTLNSLNLEILLSPLSSLNQPIPQSELEGAVLVPGHPCPTHQDLLVANGLAGAVAASALSLPKTNDAVKAAIDMPGVTEEQRLDAPGVVMMDASLAAEAVRLFREGPHNAMQYERLWYASNLPRLMAWLKASAEVEAPGSTKPAVRRLIVSLLQGAKSSISAHETACRSSNATPSLDELKKRLALWSGDAHAELRDELAVCFAGRRWRQLGWWKLFWRVDDVAMLTNEMISLRFLPTAEQELIYLAGRIAQTSQFQLPAYPQPASSAQDTSSRSGNLQWPGHIAFTRRYLQHETVPALQALAQRLVLQSLGTSGVMTSLAALLYASSLASTLYEAGAVAALGIVYSLSRLQKKWDAARAFWEGDVREEGRKAIRGAEESFDLVLCGSRDDVKGLEEVKDARELISTAEDALSRMK